MGPTGTGAGRARGPRHHLKKPFAFFSFGVNSDQSFGHKIPLPALTWRRRAQPGESFLLVARELSPFEPFRVTLEGRGTPVRSRCSHLLHGMGRIHPKNIFRQWANEFVWFWGRIRSSATSITSNTHFSVSSRLN